MFGKHGCRMEFGMGWWWIIGVICMVVNVWIVVKVINQTNRPNTRPGRRSALDILKERYAQGEIDKREFEERKKHLE